MGKKNNEIIEYAKKITTPVETNLVKLLVNKNLKSINYSKSLIDEDIEGWLYSFWVKNPKEKISFSIEIEGKENFLNSNDGDYTLIYVGKTKGKLKDRFYSHFTYTKEINNKWLNKNNGSGTIKGGILFYLNKIKPNISFYEYIEKGNLFYIKVPVECYKTRFYAESLAIGIGEPWFNLDIER